MLDPRWVNPEILFTSSPTVVHHRIASTGFPIGKQILIKPVRMHMHESKLMVKLLILSVLYRLECKEKEPSE